MGNDNSSYQQKFRNKYTFIQSSQDHNFGLIKIYRRKQLNFDYVMIIQRSMGNHELQQCKQHFQIIKANYAKHRQPMLLRLFHIQQIRRSQCGPKGLKLYIQYLNFTLKEVIQQRKICYKAFTIQEIMLILQSIIQTYHYFKQLKFNAFSIRSDNIFITPQGYLRFSPIKIQQNPQQIQACQCFQQQIVKNFQKSQRQFIIQMKNLLQEIVSICPKNDPLFYPSHQLLSNMYHSKTLVHIMQFIYKSDIDSITFGKGPMESTEISSQKQRKQFFGRKSDQYQTSLKSSYSKI